MLQAGQAEVVSNSMSKLHQTWGPPCSRALYLTLVPNASGTAWKSGQRSSSNLEIKATRPNNLPSSPCCFMITGNCRNGPAAFSFSYAQPSWQFLFRVELEAVYSMILVDFRGNNTQRTSKKQFSDFWIEQGNSLILLAQSLFPRLRWLSESEPERQREREEEHQRRCRR